MSAEKAAGRSSTESSSPSPRLSSPTSSLAQNGSKSQEAPTAPSLQDGDQHPGAAALGGNEGLSHPDPRKGCLRWPEHLWLLSSQGETVRGRCKATNLCAYCAIQAARENARMLSLDAEDHLDQAPQVVAIVGTRTPTDDPAPFYRGRELVLRALRRRWPDAEYASQLEFTTGKGAHSGGLRRPHWNLLFKGIPTDDCDQAREIVRRVWCEHVDAEPEAQYVEPLRNTGAFMEYVANHFQKVDQAPPPGFTGQRFNASRGYFTGRTRAQARQDARASLQLERELWKAAQRGLEGCEAEQAAAAAIELAAATSWRLYGPQAMYAPASADAAPGPAHVPLFILAAAWAYIEDQELVDEAHRLMDAAGDDPPDTLQAGLFNPPTQDRDDRDVG